MDEGEGALGSNDVSLTLLSSDWEDWASGGGVGGSFSLPLLLEGEVSEVPVEDGVEVSMTGADLRTWSVMDLRS